MRQDRDDEIKRDKTVWESFLGIKWVYQKGTDEANRQSAKRVSDLNEAMNQAEREKNAAIDREE